MKYKWLIKEQKEISKEFSKEFLDIAYGSEIISKLLLNRGIDSPEKAKAYKNEYEQIKKAFERIKK